MCIRDRFCTDAKEYLNQKLQKGKSAVFFSATLAPMSYYCELLGGQKEDYLLNIPGIFDKEHFQIFIDRSVSTTYQKRAAFYEPIARRIHHVVHARVGNYMVFFPSYDFMEAVYDAYTAQFEGEAGSLLLQQRHMSEGERAEFLRRFEAGGAVTAFAVAGGVFAEEMCIRDR